MPDEVSAGSPPKPSLRLLRTMTDETVTRALMGAGQMTRAELSVVTGLSKPTVAESIRRLEASGLVADTGQRTSGRGGVGTYYAMTDQAGSALAVALAPEGVVAELIAPSGVVLARAVEPVQRPAGSATVSRKLAKAARAVCGDRSPGNVRLAVISAADPVDRASGKLVHLPDSPFLIGQLDPAKVLRPVVHGPVHADNDVNWAARAERQMRLSRSQDADDFVYLFLGEGLGGALMADGEVRRGSAGLAGEVTHLLTRGIDGQAVSFTEVFAGLGLRHPGTAAVDVQALLTRVTEDDEVTRTIATAICGVLLAAIGLCDPAFVVLGGPWGTDQTLVAEVSRQSAASPRPVPIHPALVTHEPSLAGARSAAATYLRADILSRGANAG